MPLRNKHKVVLIGAGNLASSLAPALKTAGYKVIQVYSRTEVSARTLALKLACSYTSDLKSIYKDADIYIICVKDDAIKKIASALKLSGKLVIHTSGSTSLKSIEKISDNTGVLYPLQSFTKVRKISFRKIPVFIEGSTKKTLQQVRTLAGSLSDSVLSITSEDRMRLHIAAVFACNFTNHLYTVSESLLKKSNIKFAWLYPLILETTKRAEKESPSKLQTGPAIRNDKRTIRKHLALLKEEDKALASMYKILTNSIREKHKKQVKE